MTKSRWEELVVGNAVNSMIAENVKERQVGIMYIYPEYKQWLHATSAATLNLYVRSFTR